MRRWVLTVRSTGRKPAARARAVTSSVSTLLAMQKHASDSSEQQAAEAHIIAALAIELGVPIEPSSVLNAAGARMNLDGYSAEHRILAEAYSRHGKLKPVQLHKVASDALKLAFLAQTLGGSWRMFLCFADQTACGSLLGKSWLGQAIRNLGIELRVYPLPLAVRQAVLAAQERQIMVNSPT